MAYNYDQVMDALKEADRAGNTEDATRLATIAQSMKQAPVAKKPEERSFLRGAFQGAVLDPIVGTAQLISHAADTGNLTAPSPIAMGGNLLMKALTGQKPSTQPSQATQAIDKFANQYKAPEGVDVGRLVGGLVSPINYAFPEARLAGLMPNVAKGAAIGAGFGAIQPVENAPNYAEAKTEQAMFGAGAGALIPPALRGVGGIASGIKSKFLDPIADQNKIISSMLMSAVGKENAPKVINAIENIKAQTPDVNLTTGQASGSAALNAIEDALSAKNPSGAISQLNQKNRTVLADVLRNMSGDEESINMAKLARSQIAAPLYKAEEQNLYTGGPEFETLLNRAKASGALNEAQKIAEIRGTKFTLPMVDYPQYESRMVDLPMGEKVPFDFAEQAAKVSTGTDKGVLASLRSAGGLNMSELRDLVGEKATNKARVQVGTFTKAGMGLDDAVMHAVDNGYLPESVLGEVDGGAQQLRDLIQSELSGNKAQKFGIQDDLRAAWEKTMGEPPQVELHPYEGIAKSAAPETPEMTEIGKGIKGMDLMNLKKGIDQAISDATGPKKIELQSLKKDYESWLASKSPGFAQATEAFAEASKPINKMQLAKALTQKFVPSTTAVGETPSRLNAAALAKALQEKDALAKSVTKFEGAKFKTIFSPEDVKAIEGVSTDASKIAEATAMGTGFGSATARRQSIGQFINNDLENKSPVLSTMLKVFNIIPGAQYLTKGVSGAANMIGNKLNNQMTLELERMMAEDPQAVANALKLELSGVPPTIKGKILKELMDNLPAEFTTILAAKTAIQSNE
jgi:hypothetical protein